MKETLNIKESIPRERPLIAFFDFPDVFEDFYPHYGVNQQAFATTWADTANHAWLALVQKRNWRRYLVRILIKP